MHGCARLPTQVYGVLHKQIMGDLRTAAQQLGVAAAPKVLGNCEFKTEEFVRKVRAWMGEEGGREGGRGVMVMVLCVVLRTEACPPEWGVAHTFAHFALPCFGPKRRSTVALPSAQRMA